MRHGIRRSDQPKKQYETYDYLYHEHIELHRSITDIARENKTTVETIRKNLINNGIDYWTTTNLEQYTPDVVDQWESMYCDKMMSSYEISRITGVSHRTIRRYLKARGIVLRDRSEAQFVSRGKEISPEFYDPKLLEKWHWVDNLSCKDIGLKLGVDPGTVRRHMNSYGIKTKNDSESKVGLMTGSNHPNWKGGITPFNLLVREFFHVNQAPEILARDNYTCRLCGKTHTALHVHHIIPFADIINAICDDHKDLNPTNPNDLQDLYDIAVHDPRILDKDNLITYCRDCHLFKIHGYNRKTISSQASEKEEGSETIPQGSTP